MAPRGAADNERERQRIFAGDHRNAAATVADIAARTAPIPASSKWT